MRRRSLELLLRTTAATTFDWRLLPVGIARVARWSGSPSWHTVSSAHISTRRLLHASEALLPLGKLRHCDHSSAAPVGGACC